MLVSEKRNHKKQNNEKGEQKKLYQYGTYLIMIAIWDTHNVKLGI